MSSCGLQNEEGIQRPAPFFVLLVECPNTVFVYLWYPHISPQRIITLLCQMQKAGAGKSRDNLDQDILFPISFILHHQFHNSYGLAPYFHMTYAFQSKKQSGRDFWWLHRPRCFDSCHVCHCNSHNHPEARGQIKIPSFRGVVPVTDRETDGWMNTLCYYYRLSCLDINPEFYNIQNNHTEAVLSYAC